MLNLDDSSSSANINLKFSFSAYSLEKKKFSIDLSIENGCFNLYCKKNIKVEYIYKDSYVELKKKILPQNLELLFKTLNDLNNNDEINPKIIEEKNQITLIIPLKSDNSNDLKLILKENEKSEKEIIDELIIKDEEKEKNINQMLNTINLIQIQLNEKDNMIKNMENENKKYFKEELEKKMIEINNLENKINDIELKNKNFKEKVEKIR